MIIRVLILLGLLVLGPFLVLASCSMMLSAPLLILAGPNIFKPPSEYGLKLSVVADVDGQRLFYSGAVKCSVRDQRGSIAVGNWSVDADFETPYFLASDGRALVVNDLRPCLWFEEQPKAGQVYRARLGEDSYVIDTLPDVAHSLGGSMVLFDDSREPLWIARLPLEPSAAGISWGVQVESISLEVSDLPVERRFPDAIPILADVMASASIWGETPLPRRQQLFALQHAYGVGVRLESFDPSKGCGTGAGDRWVAIPNETWECGTFGIGTANHTISPDYRRIEVVPELQRAETLAGSIYAPAIIQTGFGSYASGSSLREAMFFWKPEVCVANACFHPVDGTMGSELVLANEHRRQLIKVSLVPWNLKGILQ